MTKPNPLAVRLTPELRDEVTAAATLAGMSRNAWIVAAIRHALAPPPRQAGADLSQYPAPVRAPAKESSSPLDVRVKVAKAIGATPCASCGGGNGMHQRGCTVSVPTRRR
jgi:hypothetical protein